MNKTGEFFFEADNFFAEEIGPTGLGRQELRGLHPRLERARRALKQAWLEKSVGYLSLPERRGDLNVSLAAAKKTSRRFKTLIVLGIGGSDLGARLLVRALKPARGGMEIRFLGANTDPEEIAALLESVDLKQCAINIVSKSGDTIEPMSTFLLLRERLIKKVGRAAHAAHIITTTGRSGTLRAMAEQEGYLILPVPEDIGGRWSALTPVGLFPAACAGVPVVVLLRGAKTAREKFFTTTIGDNAVLRYAGLHYLAYTKHHRAITVLMPYAARLDMLGSWFRQLWAESLGKRRTRSGRLAYIGLTPVAALGATDQHSQIQLYSEGPQDKMVTFVEVEKMRQDFVVPKSSAELDSIAFLGGHHFAEILHAERQATAHALARVGKPNGTIFVPEISGETLGELMMFFMLVTSVMGELLDINAYDQPGVEAGKKAMCALLGREGYKLPD